MEGLPFFKVERISFLSGRNFSAKAYRCCGNSEGAQKKYALK